MWQSIGRGTVALLLAASLWSGPAGAQNDGQADLDRATDRKLNVRTFSDLGEVIRLCESALAKGLDKDNAALAKELLASALIERAQTISKRVLERSPPDPKWPEYRQVALDDLEQALKHTPQQPEALFLLAKLNLLPGGDRQRATKALDDAVRFSADAPLMRVKALTLRADLQKDPKKRLDDLSEAIRTLPGSAPLLRKRGLLYADQNRLEPALADLKAAIALDPEHVDAYEEQALVLARMKRYDEALQSIAEARKRQPNAPSLLVQQALIHAMQSNFKAALDAVAKALELEPDHHDALLMRARVHQQMKQTDKAMADVDRVLELDPGNVRAMRLRTLLLAQSGKLDQMVRQLEELVQLSPEDIEVQLDLANYYATDRKPQKAIEAYTAILAKHPDNWLALRGRADTYLTSGKHAEAIADYEKAVKLQPKDPGILNNFAWVLATSPDDKLRNGQRAIKLATLACEVTDYKQAHILSTLASAHAEAGDFQTAVKWSQKAVELGKEDQKEALEKELASYRAGKPWRELLLEPPRPKPKKPEAEKPAPTKDEKPAGAGGPESPAKDASKPDAKKPAAKKGDPKKPRSRKPRPEPASPDATKPDAD